MEDNYLKRQRIYKTIMLVILTVFLTFIFTTIYISNKYDINEGNASSLLDLSSNSSNSLSKSISNIKSILDEYYLNEIDEEAINEGAIKGYVAGLGDPYTQYITKDEMEEYKVNLLGNYVGIGIYMAANTEKNTVEVIMPIKGSPAEEAGILAGDTIVSVDGIKYTGEDIDTAADKIKGKEGSKVKLEILRNQELKTFEIIRRKVMTNPVESKKMDNIGYIQITSFDENTADSFKAIFQGLKNEGITSLIIDLRNNGGGLVQAALDIADCIVPKGKDLLITVDKEKNEKIEKAEKDVLVDMPIVVLVNENSASATEILAGALKDLNEATIVGTTTYGKGVIQELLTFRDGSGLKVTVQEYYTPNRNKINGIGIEPNEVVNLPKDVVSPLYVEESKDTQLQRAVEILKGE